MGDSSRSDSSLSVHTPPDPFAQHYVLSRTLLDEENDPEIRNSALHQLIEHLTDGMERERFEEHEDLVKLLMEAFVAAIRNFDENKRCCGDAITCLGKGMYALLFSVGDERMRVLIVDERLVDFILDALSNENTSKATMATYSSACRELFEWVDRYPKAQYDAFYAKYGFKFGDFIDRLHLEDIEHMMMENGFAEYAISNNALITLIEEKFISTTGKWEKYHVVWIAYCLLDGIGRDREKLEDLLGRGFLIAARTVMSGQSGEVPNISSTAQFLQTVIEFFPAYMKMVKRLMKKMLVARLTFREEDIEAWKRLAATINIRPTRRAAYHLMWDEEEEESTVDTNASSGDITASQARLDVDQDSQGYDIPHDKLVQAESDGETATKGFDGLSLDVLLKIVGLLSVADISSFRGSCKRANEAVQSHFSNLQMKQLIKELWPRQTHQFGTLNMVLREVKILAAWAGSDLAIVNFTGIGTMTSGQLEAAFGNEPLLSVKKLNLRDVIILPKTWSALARLFPYITTVIFSEATSQFPEEIVERNEGREAKLTNEGQLKEAGLLDHERTQTLRAITKLFSKISNVYVE